MRLTLLLLFAISSLLVGQAPASHYVDVVHLHGKDAVSGTIITYDYGIRVVLVQDNGTTMDFDWNEVKRVNFRLDKNREAEIMATQSIKDESAILQEEESTRTNTKRQFSHQFRRRSFLRPRLSSATGALVFAAAGLILEEV